MGGQLEALERGGGADRGCFVDGICFDRGNALGVVVDMQSLALQVDGCAVALILAIDFESVDINTFRLPLRRHAFGGGVVGDFADALPGGVVEVVGRLRRARPDGLRRDGLEPILGVPLLDRQMRQPDVAVGVVRVVQGRRADLRGEQAVAVYANSRQSFG